MAFYCGGQKWLHLYMLDNNRSDDHKVRSSNSWMCFKKNSKFQVGISFAVLTNYVCMRAE